MRGTIINLRINGHKMTIQKTVIATALFLLHSMPSISAAAEIINFDEVTTKKREAILIPNGYAGFDWINMGVIYGPNQTGGYRSGVVSGGYVAFDYSYQPATFSRPTPFTLESIQVTKAYYDGITRFDGYVGSKLVYTKDVYSTSIAPTNAIFNWTELSRVVMSDGDDSLWTAIDNIRISAVPEPEPKALLLAGVGILSLTIYRRNKKNNSTNNKIA